MSSTVNVTRLRQNLSDYLKQVQEGHEVEATVHGKVIVRIVPEATRSTRARKKLVELRKTAVMRDVTAPTSVAWTGDRDHL